MADPAIFRRRSSVHQHRRLSTPLHKHQWDAPPTSTIYAGLSVDLSEDGSATVAVAIRDTTYLLDFLQHKVPAADKQTVSDQITDFIVKKLFSFSERHLEKVVGCAMPRRLFEECPLLCSRLWAEIDVIPLVLPQDHRDGWEHFLSHSGGKDGWVTRTLDEQAESMGRKCVRVFGPENQPLLQVGFAGLVEVDTAFHVKLANLDDFKKTVEANTWAAVQHYAKDLKDRKVKIAFFSATPQGGGVALMRHALVRFSHYLGTRIDWYVPKPRPGVFRVTKNNHNILQGVADPDQRLSKRDHDIVTDWIDENAQRYWLRENGPLLHPSKGGADVIIIDDPQMPALIPLAKKMAPDRPVIFRSHIQVRSDLISAEGSPQADAWKFLWSQIQPADVFLAHPVRAFVPHTVPDEKVGYMPASTDWLDGLNKHMHDWDVAFYGRNFNAVCRNSGMPTINFPDDEYIVQIARFDPSKGISDVVDSYDKFYNKFAASHPTRKPPMLLICGHGSVDDPDGAIVYDSTVAHIETFVPYLMKQICVVRLGPSDQLLNALMSKAKVALQLSTREGFEIKVSEALHKGKPVIATRAGGIPLQVTNEKNGFLVDVGDTEAVAEHLYDLCTDDELYHRMARYARENVFDEVSTVGNALNWFYLASKMTKSEEVKPNGRWIQDMAREEANLAFTAQDSFMKRTIDPAKAG
ncbi:putative trehalose synthase (Ccg-9) [Aspergillus candidus]|uniref:UDP-Glycosyltransferase/glycogen phosphorylase n=1 Tax=Aspergillus candidus TaxID=41067 RepID=A0A2I2FJH8_ASPCN|nr:UDP-Glycosyltransferase/glycogen phosphorylase [Aspergillus candidus]PLB40797.1 UDP-Glycosyltransferase/glycogen phosphorylase [Aspergillus candidus]